MGQNNHAQSDSKADKAANESWNNFVKVSQICGIITCVTLLIMAVTLV